MSERDKSSDGQAHALADSGSRLRPPPKPKKDKAYPASPDGAHNSMLDPPAATNVADAKSDNTLTANTDMRLKALPIAAGSPSASSIPPPASSSAGYLGCTIDGRYRIECVLGEGGMGFVYRARHKVIDKLVAIKILRQEVARDREVTDRFVMEAKAATAIGNAHIVDTIDFGQLPDGSTYLAMEYLEGKTLSQLSESEGPLAIERIVRIARQIAEGLAAAHAAAIVHRDLKPDNVFVIQKDKQPDFVKILDFGIAKVGSFQNKLTRAGAVFGTPHYMSPEQAQGLSVDHRSDIYSLGVILYEMSCGRVPFDAEAPLSILSQHLNDEPVRPSALSGLGADIPPGLEAVILKCLSKQCEDRYQSMLELIDELDKLGAGREPGAVVELSKRKTLPDAEVRNSTLPPLRSAKPRLVLFACAVAVMAAVLYAAFTVGEGSSARLVPLFLRTAPYVANADALVGMQSRSADPNGSRLVALVMSPIDAHVYRGGRDLGAMPVTLEITPGEKLVIDVRRQGFWSRKVLIDGSRARVVVRLAPIPGARLSVPVPVETPGAPDDHPIDEPAAAAEAPALVEPPIGKELPRVSEDKETKAPESKLGEKGALPESAGSPAPE